MQKACNVTEKITSSLFFVQVVVNMVVAAAMAEVVMAVETATGVRPLCDFKKYFILKIT